MVTREVAVEGPLHAAGDGDHLLRDVGDEDEEAVADELVAEIRGIPAKCLHVLGIEAARLHLSQQVIHDHVGAL